MKKDDITLDEYIRERKIAKKEGHNPALWVMRDRLEDSPSVVLILLDEAINRIERREELLGGAEARLEAERRKARDLQEKT